MASTTITFQQTSVNNQIHNYLNCHPSNQAWSRSFAIIFRDNRPLLVRSLLNNGSVVEGNYSNSEIIESSFFSAEKTDEEIKTTVATNPLVIDEASNNTSTNSKSYSSNSTTINYLDWSIFTSLDSIENNLDIIDNDALPQNINKNKNSISKNYLGVLQPSDTHKILGYVTASRINFILLLDTGKPMPREIDIKTFFENIHQLWMSISGNPFYKSGKVIKNMPKFIKMVDDLIVKL